MEGNVKVMIEQINFICRRLLETRLDTMGRDIRESIKFSGFKPYQSSNIIGAQLYIQSNMIWYAVGIELYKEDLQTAKIPESILEEKLNSAIQKLSSMIEDPFDKFVREERQKVGKNV